MLNGEALLLKGCALPLKSGASENILHQIMINFWQQDWTASSMQQEET
jgi:hypothetical protein